jgi:hypothetical protein
MRTSGELLRIHSDTKLQQLLASSLREWDALLDEQDQKGIASLENPQKEQQHN